jgi:hypothetical protein
MNANTNVNGKVAPDKLAPDELWLRINAMPRPFQLVDFPRKDPATGASVGQLAIQVLTHEESMLSQKSAATFAREALKDSKPGDPGFDDLYRNQSAIEVLYRACRREKDHRYSFFPSPGEMRKTLSADETGVLMNRYLRVQAELGPVIATMSPEELDAWTDMLIEGAEASRSFLDCFSSDAKSQLLEHLVLRLRSSSTASSSSGSPPESIAPESSPLPEEPHPVAMPTEESPAEALPNESPEPREPVGNP